MRIEAARVLTPLGLVGPAAVVCEGGVITAVEPCASAPDRTIAPGFVDLQVNGFEDVDCAAADADWTRLASLLHATGTTSWCPTLVTAPLDVLRERIDAVPDDVVGIHLEGPFLAKPGAHPPELLRAPDLDWLGALPRSVRLVTLAAELPGAVDATALLVARGVTVSIGHSRATHEQVTACVDAGARMVTHLFNGMEPLHHRTPGVVGAALTDDRLVAGLIADLVHVHPIAIAVAFRAKPGRVALVTDAVAWRAARIGRIEVEVRDGAPRLPDGTLAGSALTMDAAIRNVLAEAGVSLEDALVAATATPAAVLGLGDRGELIEGRRADLVVIDAALAVEATYVAGAQVA